MLLNVYLNALFLVDNVISVGRGSNFLFVGLFVKENNVVEGGPKRKHQKNHEDMKTSEMM